jgi:lysophospholipase L1-like esterase
MEHMPDEAPQADRTLVLLGDSILDNALYTRPAPDTATWLGQLAPDWAVLLLAQDGGTIENVPGQLRRLKQRAALAVLSAGGNDAAQHIALLDQPAFNSGEVLQQLLHIGDEFAERYETVARAVAERVDRLVLCTIYEVRLEPARYARLARVPLAVLNDRIIRIGAALGADVLELRSVCTAPEDFVLEIEPSARGAKKIAEAIVSVLHHDRALTSGRLFMAPRDRWP